MSKGKVNRVPRAKRVGKVGSVKNVGNVKGGGQKLPPNPYDPTKDS